MKKISFLCFFISYQALAFHSVTEVLPSGKILVCKSFNETKRGNMVEVYARISPRSRLYSGQQMERSSQFSLPNPGQKIKLFQESLTSTKYFSHYEVEEVGEAVVTDENLVGEGRNRYSAGKSRFSKFAESFIKITKEDNDKIHQDCLVAIPDHVAQMRENLAVKW